MALQFLFQLEARAVFIGKFPVSVDGSVWVLPPEGLNESPEGVFLCRGAGVLREVVGGETPDIADADGVGVVAGAVGSDHLGRAALLDGSVKPDDVVVANHLEAPGLVPAVDVGSGEVLALGSGGTVDDEFGDLSHKKNFLRIDKTIRIISTMQMPSDHL